MRRRQVIALAATVALVIAPAGCSSHRAATGTSSSAPTSVAAAAVPAGVWQTRDLTALADTPAAALGGVSAYLFASDRSGWRMDDLTASTGAPLSGGNGPVRYAFGRNGTLHVVYTGRDDRHIHEPWWGPRQPG